jgi:hypothetical protein
MATNEYYFGGITDVNDHYRDIILNDDPTIYYRFDESGGTTVNDLSGNEYNSTYISGITFSQNSLISNNNNNSIRVDGAGGHMLSNEYKLDISGTSIQPYTFEFWVKADSNESSYILFIQGDQSSDNKDTSIKIINNQKLIYQKIVTSVPNVSVVKSSSNFSVLHGTTNHIVITRDSNGSINFYVNGSQLSITDVGTDSLDIYSFYNTFFKLAGYGAGDLPGSLLGIMDDFSLYEYAFTADQVLSHYNAAFYEGSPGGYILPFGSNKIRVINEQATDSNLTFSTNNSKLAISYISGNYLTNNSQEDYNTTYVDIGGVPLSVSGYFDTETSDNDTVGQFFTLDVIEISDLEDIESNETITDTSFIWFGNKLSASKINNRFYVDIYEVPDPILPTYTFTIGGVPMATNTNYELLLNKTSYTLNDVEEYIIVERGGVPFTAGRIGNNNYLIVNSEFVS